MDEEKKAILVRRSDSDEVLRARAQKSLAMLMTSDGNVAKLLTALMAVLVKGLTKFEAVLVMVLKASENQPPCWSAVARGSMW